MVSEVVIEKPELQILINLLQERGEIRVSFPLYEALLFTARPLERGYAIEVKAEKRDFHVRHPELPSYSDFYEAFISSGVITYDNIEIFERTLELYRILKKGVVFAPDTNIFYHRFISNYRPLEGYQIVVAEDVKNEIEGGNELQVPLKLPSRDNGDGQKRPPSQGAEQQEDEEVQESSLHSPQGV